MADRKPWRGLGKEEISDLKRVQCVKCDYYSKTEGAWNVNATCDYLLIEGHSRGCDPRDCAEKGFFKPKTKKSRAKRPALSL